MPSQQLKRFLNPETVRQIDQDLLSEFLRPFGAYFGAHQVDVERPDHEPLIGLLIDPGTDVPGALIEALYLVHECATDDIADDLANALADTIQFSPHSTAVEVALRSWLTAPDVLRRSHAEAVARRQRSFRHYVGPSLSTQGRQRDIDPPMCRHLEEQLDIWFETHQRGRGCRVEPFAFGQKQVLVVRHGQRKVRHPSVSDDGVSSVEFFRPQIYDVLIYDPADDTIAIHTGSKSEFSLYLESVGRILFGDSAYFGAEDIFTLGPLIDSGADSMNCADIPGLESVRLVEFQRVWGGAHHEKETRQADDIFAAFAVRGASLAGGRLTYAVVKFRVAGSSKERSAKIRPAGTTFERDEDSEMLGLWMQKRGFIRKRTDEAARRVLAVA